MFCVKCRQELPEGAVFCFMCGKKQTPQERKYKKRANGTGNVYKLPGKRGKPWAARKNGVFIGTFKTRTEAEKELARITDTVINDKYNLTFAEVHDRWKAEHEREVEPKTMRDYEWAYSNCSQLHGVKMRRILRSDYQAAIILLENKGLSKSSCQKLRVLLGMLGRYAMEEGITPGNPAENLNTTAKQLSQRKIFLEAQIQDIKQSNLPAAKVALILISCGARPGELFDVPLDDCHEDYFIGGSKTEAGKDRVIPIGLDGLAAYEEMRAAAIEKGGKKLIDGYGGNKTTENFGKKGRDWDKLMQEIGCQDMTPYCCRHTFITRMIRAGVDLPKLEAIVGHVDRETTKIYTHLAAGDLVDAVQGITVNNLTVCNKSATKTKGSKSNDAKKLAK